MNGRTPFIAGNWKLKPSTASPGRISASSPTTVAVMNSSVSSRS